MLHDRLTTLYYLSCAFEDSWSFVFFFFFQAEDGIRDLTVTGVQTCALPISIFADDERDKRFVVGQRTDRGDSCARARGQGQGRSQQESAHGAGIRHV